MTAKTLIVAANYDHARNIISQYPPQDRRVLITWPGQPLTGHRFDLILITDLFDRYRRFADHLEQKLIDEWLRGVVQCRRSVDGLILAL